MQKTMNAVLAQWTDELGEEMELVQSPEINEEANQNMITYGMPREVVTTYTEEELRAFVVAHLDTYRTKAKGNPMFFYAWFDEQAGQLRMGAVSRNHKRLPFGCKLQECDLPALVESVVSGNSGLSSDHGKLKVWRQSI